MSNRNRQNTAKTEQKELEDRRVHQTPKHEGPNNLHDCKSQ